MANSKISIKKRSDLIFDIMNTTILTIGFLLVFYPLLYVVSCSFSDTKNVVSGRVWLFPMGFTLEGYTTVFESKYIWTGYLNTIFYTITGTSINLFMTLIAAYPLARKNFFGKNLIMFFFVFTMFFNGGMIPTFLLVKDLGLYNTRWALILPGAMAVWFVIIAKTYIQTNIHDSLLESAKLDGCDDFRFFVKIVLPLCKPILAVLALYYGVGHWNEFFSALIYLRSSELYPLQIILRDILVLNQFDYTMTMNVEEAVQKELLAELLKYSLIVVSTLPVVIVYPFVQKYFVKGVMIGAIKG